VDLPGDRIGAVSRDHGDHGILLHHQRVRMHAYEGTSLTFVQTFAMPDHHPGRSAGELRFHDPCRRRAVGGHLFFDNWSIPRARRSKWHRTVQRS
jgi:hypothetical protein